MNQKYIRPKNQISLLGLSSWVVLWKSTHTSTHLMSTGQSAAGPICLQDYNSILPYLERKCMKVPSQCVSSLSFLEMSFALRNNATNSNDGEYKPKFLHRRSSVRSVGEI